MRNVINLNHDWYSTHRDGREAPVDAGKRGGRDEGACHYRKTFPRPDFCPETQRAYLELHGVNASARVTLNGKAVMAHDGGCAALRADVTRLLADENSLTVALGGPSGGRGFRNALLVVVPKDHFEMDDRGGTGLKITPNVEGRDGRIRVETAHRAADAWVAVRLLDAECRVVARGEGTDVTLTIPDVRLWNGTKDPYLYVCEARLMVEGKVVDMVASTFGVGPQAPPPGVPGP